jgi:hypothetical protein
MADQQLFVTHQCNVSPLLHVSDILPFWIQFGRLGATATRSFNGITSCKVAVILYIILCEINFVFRPELVVHYNSILSDILFDNLFINVSYNYFLCETTPPMGANSVLINNQKLIDIIRNCNILPMGLYDIVKQSMEHYFLIVKFSEDDYRIISAYGGEGIYVELSESQISLDQLLQFVDNVNNRNIKLVGEFIRQYFLTGNLSEEQINKEIKSYSKKLQLFYFNNLVGQIKYFVSSYKYQAVGGYKKRIHKSPRIHRRRKSTAPRDHYAKRTRTRRTRRTRRRRN